MASESTLSPDSRQRTVRTVLTRTVAGIVLATVFIAVGALTASLMLHTHTPQTLAVRVHHWLALARPWVLGLQLGTLSAVWWKWPAIVKRAHFAAAVEDAWLAARDRMFYWGLAMIGLSVLLWSA